MTDVTIYDYGIAQHVVIETTRARDSISFQYDVSEPAGPHFAHIVFECGNLEAFNEVCEFHTFLNTCFFTKQVIQIYP